ncbi:hypothetical protein L484_015927 [Morus notabilis]|uniref:Short-chain dehydrogenase TIC 32 n=2 Tax=Morus notabilis TaxID=981085 RepID=W9QNP3_9ROSA|nr:hypothetical protein L484_015927 [Morus notabilis]
MKKTTQQSGKEGRIVNVSSTGHRFTYREGIRFEQINDPSGYGKLGAAGYGQSKLANILHANELARRLKEEAVNITANSLHPGAIATNIFRYNAIVNGNTTFSNQNIQENLVSQGEKSADFIRFQPIYSANSLHPGCFDIK